MSKLSLLFTVTALCLVQMCMCGSPPRVDGKPNLLDSFIPASMQIMAHLTELMKYDLKPSSNPTTTTSVPPTPAHKPAIHAPDLPPGPEAYFSKGLSYEEYVAKMQNPGQFNYYWLDRQNRYARSLKSDTDENSLERYFGRSFTNLLALANRIEAETGYNRRSVEEQVQEFSQNYDDSDFRFVLLRKKQVPPTKAYVTLLSLYDAMNKEAKKLGLNKYQGYTDAVLNQLVESATGTSAYQLRYVMNKIVERQDTKKADTINKIKKLIADLDQDNSYINDALRYIPPLPFIL